MLKKSFFNRQAPAITMLTNGASIRDLVAAARTAQFDGADAVALELGLLPPEERTKANFEHIMNEVRLPFMFILYRNDQWLKDDDDARQKYLLEAVKAGAEVVDVMGDLYQPSKYQLATDPAAIRKQKRLIKKIHEMGGKVIMSSHMSEFRTGEEILEHMLEQKSRGADILKLVTTCNTEEELNAQIATTMMLNRKLDTPFVHLCNGKWARLHRYLSPVLGSSIAFATAGFQTPNPLFFQPTVKAFKGYLANMPWHIDEVQQ